MVFNPSEKDSFLDKLNEIIAANLSNEHFGVSELASEMGMSRSSLHRKVKAITHITVSQYLREKRLNRALELLRGSSMSISEVAIESGFNSPAYFANCFKQYYGVPPSKFSQIETTTRSPDSIAQQQHKKKKHPIKARNRWIIVALITIIFVILLALFLGPAIPNPLAREKTIAILPYSDDTPEGGNAFLIDGLLNEVRYKLSLVEDLTVAPRNTVERFRNTDKTWKEIGKELHVNYILECRSDSIKGRTLISLRLIDAGNSKNLWSEPYEKEISLDNILDVQKEVARMVSDGLKAVIEGEEKEQIDSRPTESLAAYNTYMLGSYYKNISIYSPDRESSNQAIRKARMFFEQAIDMDSTFSDAYAALGLVYINNLYYSTRNPDIARKRLETGHSFLENALFYDEGNLEALRGKATFYDRIGLHKEANDIWKRLSKYTEPSYEYYQHKAQRFSEMGDYYSATESYEKYLRLKPVKSIQPPRLLRSMIWIFRETGFHELEKALADQLLEFTRDSIEYFQNMMSLEIFQADFRAALNNAQIALSFDTTNRYSNWCVGLCYLWLNDWSNALHNIIVSEDIAKRAGRKIRPQYLSGYAYHMNGQDEEASYHFKGAIDQRQKEIEHAAPYAQQYYSQFYLANIYLALGDENKALEYIKILDSPGMIDYGFINILINWTELRSK